MNSGRKICFYAEPWYGDDKAKRDKAEKIFEEVVEPAVDGRGFHIVRSTALPHPDYVTREHLRLATTEALMIADISIYDPMVVFCLAAREALKLDACGERAGAARAHLWTLLLLEEGNRALFEVPGIYAYPVRYLYDQPPRAAGEREEAGTLRTMHLLDARRDLTRHIERLFALHTEAMCGKAEQAEPAYAEAPAEPTQNGGGGADAEVRNAAIQELMRRIFGNERNAADVIDRMRGSMFTDRPPRPRY
ncbi:MAG: hypothetical protein HQL40_02375 [Alphaproteobacteria bacterium]|nr:hypothetical protein [Alphaproteobacteria bacterium]